MLNPINYIEELGNAMRIALFRKTAMQAVATEKGKTTFAYLIIIATEVILIITALLAPAFYRPSLISAILGTTMQMIMIVIGIYALSFVAVKFFKGSGRHDQFFRVASYSMIIYWLMIIYPLINLITVSSLLGGVIMMFTIYPIVLWILALMFVILKTVHKLTTGGAIGTVIIGFIFMMIMGSITLPLQKILDFS